MGTAAGYYFPLSDDQRRSFKNGCKFEEFSKGITLYRLVGRWEGISSKEFADLGKRDIRDQAIGRYWFSADYFWDVIEFITNLPADQLDSRAANDLLHLIVRDQLAVSQDWNKFQFIAELRVPKGFRFSAYVGRIAAQQENSRGSQAYKTDGPGRTLKGGGTQYLISLEALKGPLKPYITYDQRPFRISGIANLSRTH